MLLSESVWTVSDLGNDLSVILILRRLMLYAGSKNCCAVKLHCDVLSVRVNTSANSNLNSDPDVSS